jgi:hypothetical protein
MSMRIWLGERCIRVGNALLREDGSPNLVEETINKPLTNAVYVHNFGMDLESARAAAERVWERRNAVGGFGR